MVTTDIGMRPAKPTSLRLKEWFFSVCQLGYSFVGSGLFIDTAEMRNNIWKIVFGGGQLDVTLMLCCASSSKMADPISEISVGWYLKSQSGLDMPSSIATGKLRRSLAKIWVFKVGWNCPISLYIATSSGALFKGDCLCAPVIAARVSRIPVFIHESDCHR